MYVTLPSHANRQEFPNNQANWFKTRLPQPLRLTGESWQVGLSSISIPDTGVNLGHLVPPGQAVFGFSCVRKLLINKLIYHFHNMTMEDLKDDDSVLDGVSFMKAFLRWMKQQEADDYKHEYESVAKHSGKNTCLLFKWDNDDLVMDNSNVIRQRFPRVADLLPHFAFHTLLGQKMGWIQQNTHGDWELGSNLQMIFHIDKVPFKGVSDFRDRDGNPL